MGNEKEKLHVTLNYDETQTIPLALHEMHMARNDRRMFWERICWAVALIITVVSFVWLWNQYDYSSSTELSGVYNLVDSEGNVISSDLSPEDVARIMEGLGNGQNQADKNP